MITYLDYTLVPLPCPRTQHSRLFLSWKPLTLKIRSSAIPFLWKRVNNMFQRDWKVIFFFIKSLARQNCLQPCGRNRPFAYIESGLNYQTRTGIRTSPSRVLRFKHRVTIILTWRDHPYIEKKARSVNPPADGAWKLLDGALALLLPTSLTATTRKVYLTCGDNAICTHPFWGSDPLEMTFHVVGANCVVCSIITFFIGLPFAFPRIHVTLTCSPSACPWLMVTSVGGLGGP